MSNQQITVFAPGVRYVTGDILNVNAAGVTMRFKKPRSSKYLIETFPANDILFTVSGEEGELNAEIMVRGDRVEQYTLVGEVGEDENGNLTVTTEDGNVLTLSAGTTAEIVGEDDEEAAPKKAGKAAKADKGGKGKKAAAVEEEEEEEKPAKKGKKAAAVEEDDDDADEKPAKKGKKDKAEKPGKGKKAAADDSGDW